MSLGLGLGLGLGSPSGAPVPSIPAALLSGAVLWFRSDPADLTIATGVSAWANKVVGGSAAVQATGAAQPAVTTNAINGRAAVTADGVNDRLAGTLTRAAPGTQPFYLWFLLSQVTWTINDLVYSDGGAALFQGATTPRLRGNNGVNSTENAAAAVGTFKFVEMQFGNSAADYVRIGSTQVSGVNMGNLAGTGAFSLFGSVGGSAFANVSLCEMGCYLGTPDGTGGLAGGGLRAALAQYMYDLYGPAVLV